VATALCLICSLLVSGVAVMLRPRIDSNRLLKKQRNVLVAAGLFDPAVHTDKDIPRLFEIVETVAIRLPARGTNGEILEEDGDAGFISGDVEVDDYDPRKAAKDIKQSVAIPAESDIAGIKRRERIGVVYLVKGADGAVEQIVLPVYGKGLWSTLYGFLALEADASGNFPVTGITFYEHAETPGLGGEVDNPNWKAQWPGKTLLSEQGVPMLDVTKPGVANAEHEIDGLSGATITSNGVESLVNYWLGPDGFGPFLERFRQGELEFTAEATDSTSPAAYIEK
jgi:Na+-transporting NADH:ubiquinone oxidoreductase subunit C